MNLAEFLQQGESEILEFKTAFNEDVLESIGAFSNARGGAVLVGVEDTGTVRGVQIGRKTLEDWANRIQASTDPRLQPSINKVDHNGKTVVAITIESAAGVPVSVRGRYFRRVGRTNQRMSHQEIIQRMILGSGLSWDAVIEPEASWDDLDPEKIQKFMAAVRRTGRRPIPEGTGEHEFLEKLKFLQDSRPTRAALLLFAKEESRYFPSAFLKLGRFRSPILIVDDREVHGTLVDQVDGAMAWFRERLQTQFVITGKPQRDVIWEYPLEAVREAIVNAVCHRDYMSLAHVQVRLYDDRLEIWNPGGLPPPLIPADLLRPHESMPRNRQVADAFFYIGLIERWGTGTIRMADVLREAGLPEPEFDASNPGQFRLRLHQTLFTDERLRQMGLNERQTQAVHLLGEQGTLTNRHYQEIFSVSKRTASNELRDLVKQGVLARHGTTGKGTYYTLQGQQRGNRGNKGATKGQNAPLPNSEEA